MLGNALDSSNLAAFMCIGIGKDDSLVQPDLGIQPTIPVRRKAAMVLLKQLDALSKLFLLFRWIFNALLPIVETAAWNADLFAEQLDRELPGKLRDYLVLFLPIGMNFFSAPTPSTR